MGEERTRASGDNFDGAKFGAAALRLISEYATRQAAEIEERIVQAGLRSVFSFGPPAPATAIAVRSHSTAAPLPDARIIRQWIHNRRLRERFFGGKLFADPAWDMLLDLTAATVERKRVTITSLCLASGVPATTALRWVGQMVEEGLLERSDDQIDRRRAFVTLTDKALKAMAAYFAKVDMVAFTMGR